MAWSGVPGPMDVKADVKVRYESPRAFFFFFLSFFFLPFRPLLSSQRRCATAIPPPLFFFFLSLLRHELRQRQRQTLSTRHSFPFFTSSLTFCAALYNGLLPSAFFFSQPPQTHEPRQRQRQRQRQTPDASLSPAFLFLVRLPCSLLQTDESKRVCRSREIKLAPAKETRKE